MWRKSGLNLVLAMASLGVLTVAGLHLPAVSRALDGPGFCGSCHVMSSQVESHLRSSHRDVPCGECHLPRGLLRYPMAKAYAGGKDVLVLLAGSTPETIRLAPGGQKVVQENCLRCHGDMTPDTAAGEGYFCFDCHRRVPHGP